MAAESEKGCLRVPSRVTDANMNVTALVATDGDVVERYMYDPYGQVLVLNGADDADDQVSDWSEDADNTSDWDNEVLFAGYRFGGGERLAGVLGCGGG